MCELLAACRNDNKFGKYKGNSIALKRIPNEHCEQNVVAFQRFCEYNIIKKNLRRKEAAERMSNMEYNELRKLHLVSEEDLRALERTRMELKQREIELKRREEIVEQEEQFALFRAKALNRWEACLTEREKQDRGQAIAHLAEIHDGADAVYTQVREAVQAIRELAKPLVAAQNVCTGSFFVPGMKELCKISEEMRQSAEKEKNPVIAYYANAVDNALSQLGCTPIVPALNRPFDRYQAVPLDAGQRGNIVAKVCEIGWKFDDTVLKKAVVMVKEN